MLDVQDRLREKGKLLRKANRSMATAVDAARPAPAGQGATGRWKTPTFIAALRHDRVVSPWLIEGPINGESFLPYVERVLAPALTA